MPKKQKDDAPTPALNSQSAGQQLRSFVERVERLQAEKADIAKQEKEVFSEAKGAGYDTKVLRKIIAERKQDPDAVSEFEAILELYRTALGMGGYTVADDEPAKTEDDDSAGLV